MTVSVIMATYNGEKYIKEQLDSIMNQTVKVGEIIICDDNSTDATREIINEFANNSRVPINLYVNEKTLGSTKNFEKAMSLASGDIVFLSDQDDVWMENKVEKQLEIFNKSNADLVFSNAFLYKNGQILDTSLWESIGFEYNKALFEKDKLDYALHIPVVTGACLAVKRNSVMPFNYVYPEIVHDMWYFICMLCAGLKIEYCEEKLIKYRLHSSQQIGTRIVKCENVQRTIAYLGGLYPAHICPDYNLNLPEKYLIKAQKCYLGRVKRKKIKSKRVVSRFFSAIGFYLSKGYSSIGCLNPFKSCVKDIIKP